MIQITTRVHQLRTCRSTPFRRTVHASRRRALISSECTLCVCSQRKRVRTAVRQTEEAQTNPRDDLSRRSHSILRSRAEQSKGSSIQNDPISRNREPTRASVPSPILKLETHRNNQQINPQRKSKWRLNAALALSGHAVFEDHRFRLRVPDQVHLFALPLFRNAQIELEPNRRPAGKPAQR